jgi:hypothetical protein
VSHQIGDRYTCSDPNCGCEVALEQPCKVHRFPLGLSGEGLFGTTGSGRSATASGRYESATSIPNEPRPISGEPTQERFLTGFCGSRMRLSTQSSRAVSAR